MVTVENLHFSYSENEDTLKGLNFEIKKGEIFGFLGPSGAGKSTTQKIMIGILKNFHGKIRVMDRDLPSYGHEYYEKIGVVFEFPNLYSKFTALENLMYFKALYTSPTDDPHALLQLVGLTEDTHTRVSSFSKGMKMRLNFCRALLHRPQLLFLDEPTSGLDPLNAKKVRQIILERKSQGTTVFLTTHNMQLAEDICDRVAFIVDGQIVLIDSPHELKLRSGKKLVRVEYGVDGQVQVEDFPLESLGSNPKYLSVLNRYEIRTMHTQEATLEDIFINVTGRSLI